MFSKLGQIELKYEGNKPKLRRASLFATVHVGKYGQVTFNQYFTEMRNLSEIINTKFQLVIGRLGKVTSNFGLFLNNILSKPDRIGDQKVLYIYKDKQE